MFDIMTHLHHSPNGVRTADTSNFSYYDSVTFVKKDMMNIKLNLNISFDTRIILNFLQLFFNITIGHIGAGRFIDTSYVDLKNGKNVAYHATIPAANLATTIARRPTAYALLTDDHGEQYTFSEIGVYICLFKNQAGHVVFDRNNANIEVKFFSNTRPNVRMIVNIHINHQTNNINYKNNHLVDVYTKNTINDFNDLIFSLRDVVNLTEMSLCKNIDLYNYRTNDYSVKPNSEAFYNRVCAGIFPSVVQERDAAQAQVQTLTQERDAAQAQVQTLTQERDTVQTQILTQGNIVNQTLFAQPSGINNQIIRARSLSW